MAIDESTQDFIDEVKGLLRPRGNGCSTITTPATKNQLGGVIVGEGIDVTPEGVISVDTSEITAEVCKDISAKDEDVGKILDDAFD